MSALLDAHGRPVYAPSTLARWVAGINYGARRRRVRPAWCRPGRVGGAVGDPAAGAAARPPGARPHPRPAPPRGRRDRPADLAVRGDRSPGPADTAARLHHAMRRSELAGLRVGDVVDAGSEGLRVRLRRSKTDQEGSGAVASGAGGVRARRLRSVRLDDLATAVPPGGIADQDDGAGAGIRPRPARLHELPGARADRDRPAVGDDAGPGGGRVPGRCCGPVAATVSSTMRPCPGRRSTRW